MFLNIFILLFIIGIAYWQGLQGFFSAFLHLVLVIVAGALAFAFWEPISMGVVAGMTPRYAWAIGLLFPFVFFLLVLRVLMDKLVPANVDFSQLTNLLAGGVCGAIAAALTAGIFVISISYLPGPGDSFGYKPYTIDPASGKPVPNSGGGLWIGVDSLAAGVFSTLSSGTFAPANGKSLATHQPDLVRRASLLRLRNDPNTSIVATPESVTIANHYSHPLPAEQLPAILTDNLKDADAAALKNEKNRLVAIETSWKSFNLNYDQDRLRVYPHQVQLVTSAKDGPLDPVIHLPIAVSLKGAGERELSVVNRDDVQVASGSTADASVAFFFVVPVNQVEQYLLVRNLRLELTPPAPAEEPPTEKVVAVIGPALAKSATAGDGTKDDGKGTVGETTGGKTSVKPEDVVVTALLPKVTSRNLLTAFEVNARNELRAGRGTANDSDGPISPANQVKQFYVPEDQAMVRVKLDRRVAHSYLSHAQAAAANLNAMFITDNKGNQWYPSGYVWVQAASKAMNIRFDMQQQIRAVAELPIRGMGDADELYVYFVVAKGIRLDKLKVGEVQSTELNRLEVP